MKISEMDRVSLRDFMRGNGDLYRYDSKAPTWKRAFELAKKSGMENYSMDCTKCVGKVWDWLKA